jgi:hypothetical protein
MSFNQRDQKILSELGKARMIHQDIQELLSFYANLFEVQFAFKSRLGALGKAGDLEKKEINLKALSDGFPQITFEELNIQATPFLGLYESIVRILVPFAGNRDGLDTEAPPEKILQWAREIFDSRGPLVIAGPTVNLARTAAGFVLAPYLQLASDLILPRIPLDLWYREYCPICGGRPCFAALTSGAGHKTAPAGGGLSYAGTRTLLCPRCYGEWSYDRIGCPFCKSRDSQTYYSDDEGRYRLYVCEACKQYIKTIDMREADMDLCLPIECLVTVSLDIAAQEKGFKSY